MEYISIKKNDEAEYIYREAEKLLRPSSTVKAPRNPQKEAEYYAVQDAFCEASPIALEWRMLYKIPMFSGLSGVRYRVYNFSNGRENALVAAQYDQNDEMHYKLPPNPIFYNQGRIQGSRHILFSDNLTLAHALSTYGQFDVEVDWARVSFLSRDELPSLNFSLFKGKTVLYYLAEHSGYDWRQTCLNAADIVKLFPESAEIYFVSYPERDYRPSSIKDPVFLSSRKQFDAEVERLEKEPANMEAPLWMAPSSNPRRLLADGLMERTATLLYDASPMDRTSYLTHWAAAISQGKSNIRAYKKFPPVGVAYIYANSADDDFRNGAQNGFSDMTGQNFSVPAENRYPTTVIEARSLMQQDIFAAYPVSDNPFAKFERNTFVYLSFRPCTAPGANLPETMIQILEVAISSLERHHPDTKILIIDIPVLWTIGIDFALLMGMLYSPRDRYAVILSTNRPHPMQKSSIRNLPFDKIIRMQRQNSDPEQMHLDLITIRNDIDRRKDDRLLAKAVGDKQWKTRGAEKTSVAEKINYIRRHRNKTIRDLVAALGISESYAKKLRVKAGVSTKMPSRAPKLPRHKSPYSQSESK